MIKFYLFRKLFFKLLASYLVVVFLALIVLGVLFVYMMHKYFFRVEGWELSARADKVISLLKEPIVEDNREKIKEITDTVAYSYDVKLWVVDKNGNTLASSESDETDSGLKLEDHEMENVLNGNIITKQITGPEFNSLLCVKPIIINVNAEKDPTLLEPPEIKKEDVWGVLAIEAPLGKISSTITNIAKLGIMATLPAFIFAVIVGYTISRRISRPIEEMDAVARDISEGKWEKRVQYKSGDEMDQLSQTFNQAVEQIVSTVEKQKKLERLRKEFLSNIAHEFKAPLTSIRGFVELMLDGKLKQDKQSNYLEIMLQDTIHLNRLVQDLLDLSNLESGEVSFDMSHLNPGELVQWIVEHFQPEAESNHVQLSANIEPNLPLVKCDKDRLNQVLFNLVKNAFQHTPPGGEIEVAIYRSKEKPGTVFFAVKDTGGGIPEEELGNIWDRFYKIDRSRTRKDKDKSTGLGLAIVKEIIRRHNGQVYVDSKVGEGSVFGFYLPAGN